MNSDKPSRSVASVFFLLLFLFFIFVALCAVVIKFFSQGMKGPSSASQSTESSLDDSEAPIAVVTIEGVIMTSKKVIEELAIAEEDKDIKAIILRIDSPGGAVGPSQEIYEEVARINKIKPVYASFGTVAASGGYYIGSATKRIYANAGTLTGSIGVIMQFMDLSKLYEWAKLNPETLHAGKFKATGNPERPMTSEEKALMQSLLDNVHQQFINDVKKGRGNRLKRPLEELAQGQIFSGEQAKEVGLVDEIDGLWQAGRKIHKELKLKGDFSLRYIKLKKPIDWTLFFEEVEEGRSFLKHSLQSKFVPMFLSR